MKAFIDAISAISTKWLMGYEKFPGIVGLVAVVSISAMGWLVVYMLWKTIEKII